MITVEQQIFKNMQTIGLIGENGKHTFGEFVKLKNPPYMDLNVDFLYDYGDRYTFAMAHNSIQNGDVMADPDMEVEVDPIKKTVRGTYFQNDYVGYHRADDTVQNQRDLNGFLRMWTENLIEQGFKYE